LWAGPTQKNLWTRASSPPPPTTYACELLPYQACGLVRLGVSDEKDPEYHHDRHLVLFALLDWIQRLGLMVDTLSIILTKPLDPIGSSGPLTINYTNASSGLMDLMDHCIQVVQGAHSISRLFLDLGPRWLWGTSVWINQRSQSYSIPGT